MTSWDLSKAHDFMGFIVTIFLRFFVSSNQSPVFDDVMLFLVILHFRAIGKFDVKKPECRANDFLSKYEILGEVISLRLQVFEF